MSHDNQIGLQLTGKKRDMDQRVANREMGRCDDAARSERLDAVVEYLPRRLLQRIERHGRRNVGPLRPRQAIQNGKQVRFRVKLLR
jgi:hypothetical protein